MIEPSPTNTIDPTIARGVLAENHPATYSKPAQIVLAIPNTNYQLHLVPTGPITVEAGKRILGTIQASARRVDVVDTGGRYIEPVFGRPRRIQGRVLAGSDDTRMLVVDAAVPIHCKLTDFRQKPSQFAVGELVSFDALEGATFTPTAG